MNKSTILKDYNDHVIYPKTLYENVIGLPSITGRQKIFFGSGKPSSNKSEFSNPEHNDIYINTDAENRQGYFYVLTNVAGSVVVWSRAYGNYTVQNTDPPNTTIGYNQYDAPSLRVGLLWLNSSRNKIFVCMGSSGSIITWKELTDFYTKSEVDALLDELRFKINKKANTIEETKTGSVITLVDSSNRKIPSINIMGKSYQNGVPTIDAPVDIEDLTPNISVRGKNLIDLADLTKSNLAKANCTYTITDKINLTATTDSTIVIGNHRSTGSTYPDNYKDRLILIPVEEGISLFTSTTDNVFNNIYFDFIDDTFTVIEAKANSNVIDKKVIAPTGSKYVSVRIGVGNAVTGTTYSDNIQIEIGDSATEFEYYKTAQNTESSILLRGIPVTGNNYTYIDQNNQKWICDTIEKYKDGTGKLIQRIQRIIEDGTYGWTDYTGDSVFFQWTGRNYPRALASNPSNIRSLCSRFGELVANPTSVASNDNTYNIAASYFVCSPTINGTRLKRTEFKNWLVNNPMIIEYCIETPIETPLTAEQLAELDLSTYKPVTNIISNTNVEVTYVADTKNYIDKRMSELQNAIISQGGNV